LLPNALREPRDAMVGRPQYVSHWPALLVSASGSARLLRYGCALTAEEGDELPS
jgi:hypothetical protein